jgi:hypothetical protein
MLGLIYKAKKPKAKVHPADKQLVSQTAPVQLSLTWLSQHCVQDAPCPRGRDPRQGRRLTGVAVGQALNRM